jgi:hypothetical protein
VSLDLANFEQQTSDAVRAFWDTRFAAAERQELAGIVDQGGRSSVTSGKTMDGFVKLIADLVVANGLDDARVYLTRGYNTLPGYYRPTKDWDLLVMRGDVLIAAIELKSQVGSFGNNFNNRTEEAIGSALDLWTAFREGAMGSQPPPFVGWLMHVEDAYGSRKPVRAHSPHFPVEDEFRGASYLDRYDILCDRLVLEKLYTATALVTSTEEGGRRGEWADSDRNGLRRFVAAFSAHIAAEAATL